MTLTQPSLAISVLMALLAAGYGHGVASAQESDGLPPNWKAGGKTREGYYYEENKKRNKRRQKPTEDSSNTGESPSEKSEAQFEPTPQKNRRSTFSLYASSPEIVRFDYNYSFSSKLAFIFALSAPFPIDVEVSMPSDVIKADQSQTIAVAYPAFDMNFKVDWGPYLHTGVTWHPFGGHWYTSLAGGVRSIKITGDASSPLRICTVAEAAKEPPCGNDGAAIQTRNTIAISADIKLISTFARLATGWIYNLGPAWAVNAELGIFAPVTTSQASDIKAAIVAPDGTPESLSGALSDLRAKSEVDLAAKAEAELKRATKAPLPVLALGLGYRF
jgi:hypothetical protein